ncbi:hypothetical protein MUK70_03320 [Dyadobacter chenwenxiniae]|uniref:Uncharacterized protein n=1 Tax=Dyadobacter chenwenxiniae TaxID=2906456 RepID=A0A9X1PJI7_9BACT|nr:hypothetical protein [Dyadobacter chenwenxiniae]MCF0062220.1 hypothetical protein [Dyadobacter chenwenxiniae]UON84024.1 hypothetical protein MUK70_03320 [Dyadobacter chenwenxiniae]
METTNEQKRLQIQKIINDLKEIGDEISYEQATLMLNSMQQLVTLAVNQYFRDIINSESISSTKR